MKTVDVQTLDAWINAGRVDPLVWAKLSATEQAETMKLMKQRAKGLDGSGAPVQAPAPAPAVSNVPNAAQAARIAAQTLVEYATKATDKAWRVKFPTVAAWLDAHQAWPAATAAASPDPARDGRPVELRAADEWQVNPEIRAEFMGDRERYLQFRRAEEKGLALKERRRMTVRLNPEEEAAARRGELSVG